MDFLLECIGFPPDAELGPLAEHVLAEGDPTPWRGPTGLHRALPLGGGLELRLDQDEGENTPTLWPWFRSDRRLRARIEELAPVPDSPFDLLVRGVANPDIPVDPREIPRHWPLAAYLTDRRRIPADLRQGHVLSVGLAGFALDVTWIGPNSEVHDPSFLELPSGACLHPLAGEDIPGGCMEVSARVKEVRHLENPITGAPVAVCEIDAPGRPLPLFLSRWQLARDGLLAPRPGFRIEGVFLFIGRVTGGLPRHAHRTARSFG